MPTYTPAELKARLNEAIERLNVSLAQAEARLAHIASEGPGTEQVSVPMPTGRLLQLSKDRALWSLYVCDADGTNKRPILKAGRLERIAAASCLVELEAAMYRAGEELLGTIDAAAQRAAEYARGE
jgi:hypothetical protein